MELNPKKEVKKIWEENFTRNDKVKKVRKLEKLYLLMNGHCSSNGSGVCYLIHIPYTCCKLYMLIELISKIQTFIKTSDCISKTT